MGFLAFILIVIALASLVYAVALAYTAVRPPRRTAGYAVARGMACDPGDMGLTFEEWIVDRPDGVRLPVWSIEGELSEGPVIVMVHGWGRSRIDMLARCTPWRGRASRLVLYDARGHGESSPERGITRLGSDEHADLLAVLATIEAERVALIAHSMGSAIAIHAAATVGEDGPAIAGILAYGPYAEFHRSLIGRLRKFNLPARPFSDIAMAWFRLRGLRFRNILTDAERLNCPLHIVHGTADVVSPFEHGRLLAQKAPLGTLHPIEGASHSVMRELDDAEHERIIETFMKALS